MLGDRPDEPRIIEIALGDDDDMASERVAFGMRRDGDLAQQVRRAEIEDAVHGVEPQAVEVILRHPVSGIVDDVPPHVVAAGIVVVERRPPRCLVLLGEIGPEERKVVPLRADVIVDDVENDREPFRVCGVDELLQPRRSTVRVLDRVQRHAVVAPVARSGELRDGHDLDRRYAELAAQAAQEWNRGGEGACVGERTNVQLIDREVPHRDTAPALVAPSECRGIDDARWTVDARWLPAAHGVGNETVVVVEEETVIAPGARAADRSLVHAALAAMKLLLPGILSAHQSHANAAGVRRPNAKAHGGAVVHDRRAAIEPPADGGGYGHAQRSTQMVGREKDIREL